MKNKIEEDNSLMIIEKDELELYEGKPMTEEEREQRKEEVKEFGGYEAK